MTFGQIKTIYETYLTSNYQNKDKFKISINEFKKDILENKEISKLYSLYDELSKPQGLNSEESSEFLKETIDLIKNLLKKTKLPSGKIKNFPNKYEDIDLLVYENSKNLDIKRRLESKKKIVSVLSESVTSHSDNVQIPLKSMISIGNSQINNYLNSLDETSKSEILNILNEDKVEQILKFNEMKEVTIQKLDSLANNSSDTEKEKINETREKIKNEIYNHLNYYRLKNLYESI